MGATFCSGHAGHFAEIESRSWPDMWRERTSCVVATSAVACALRRVLVGDIRNSRGTTDARPLII